MEDAAGSILPTWRQRGPSTWKLEADYLGRRGNEVVKATTLSDQQLRLAEAAFVRRRAVVSEKYLRGGVHGRSSHLAVEPVKAIGDFIAYHDRTKHHPERYANGPGGLDWANQPESRLRPLVQ